MTNATDAVATVLVINTKQEPTSEKLTALKTERKDWNEKMKAAEFDTPDWLAAQMEIYRIGNLIKAEIAEIAKIEADKIISEKRQARIALCNNFEEALRKSLHFEATYDHTKKDYMAKSNDLNDAVKTAREIVHNELLAKYATSAPSRSVATGEKAATGVKGDTAAAIVELFKAGRLAGGKTDAQIKNEIVAAGYAVGTVGSAILAYERLIGEKPAKA